MTEEGKTPTEWQATEGGLGLDGATSRRSFLKGAFSGAGALAIGAYAKGPSSPLSVKSFSRPTSKRSGTLVFALNSAPATIDPALANELASSATLYTIYDSLCQFDRSYKTLQPSLAVSWTSNADDTEWVFNLRPNVKFHDGTPFNSTTVRESILHFVAAGYGSLYGSIKTIDDSYPHVLKISLSQPSPDLALNQCFARVMSPKLLAEKGTLNNAVGTGAFQLVSWKPASQIVVAANPNYWGSPEPYLDGIKFSVVGNETARVDGLISGGLDVIEQVDPHDLSLLLGAPKVRLSGAPAWTEICLLNVCTQAPTNDVRVRQAVAYGIDRDALVRDVLLGQGTVATSPIPQGCYGHVTPSTGYEYSPSTARRLLKEAGYPKGLDIAMAGSSDLAIEEPARPSHGRPALRSRLQCQLRHGRHWRPRLGRALAASEAPAVHDPLRLDQRRPLALRRRGHRAARQVQGLGPIEPDPQEQHDAGRAGPDELPDPGPEPVDAAAAAPATVLPLQQRRLLASGAGLRDPEGRVPPRSHLGLARLEGRRVDPQGTR